MNREFLVLKNKKRRPKLRCPMKNAYLIFLILDNININICMNKCDTLNGFLFIYLLKFKED